MGVDFDIDSGQMVKIKLNSDTIFTGICMGNNRSGPTYGGVRKTSYNMEGLKTMLQKKAIAYLTFNTGTSISAAVKNTRIMDYTYGLTAGDIRVNDVFEEKQIIDGKNITELLDEWANIAAAHWFIDHDLKLNFYTTVSIASCSVTVDTDFGTFTDFRNVTIDESIAEYSNCVLLIGGENNGATNRIFRYNNDDFDEMMNRTGYSSPCYEVISDNSVVERAVRYMQLTSSISAIQVFHAAPALGVGSGDMIYNKTLKEYAFCTTVSVDTTTQTIFSITPSIPGMTTGDAIYMYPTLNKNVRTYVSKKCGYPPHTVKFDSFTNNFNVRTRLYVNIPDLMVQGYYNIIGVEVTDLGGDNWNFAVTAERKNYNDYSVFSDLGYRQYFKKKK